MNFKVENRIGVKAPAERIWDLITDLPSWDRWNPIETQVEGVIAYGGSLTLTEAIPGMPERRISVRIGEWQPNAQLVWIEKRGWLFNVVRYYEIDRLTPENSILATGMIFTGLRGEIYQDKNKKLLKPAMASIGEGLRAAAEA